MLCDICKKKEAKVFFTEVVEGGTKKINLCEACSKEKGVEDPTTFALADLLLGLGASQELVQGAEGAQTKCPHCGFSHADFKKTGRFGCAECYKTFGEGLENLLKSMHKGTRHAGKTPQAFQQNRDAAEKLKALEKKLSQAVAGEDYEQAARLRDEIKAAKQKLNAVAAT